VVIWHIFTHFGTLYREKSGNPAVDTNSRSLLFFVSQSVISKLLGPRPIRHQGKCSLPTLITKGKRVKKQVWLFKEEKIY
jgi:hypothetical protein